MTNTKRITERLTEDLVNSQWLEQNAQRFMLIKGNIMMRRNLDDDLSFLTKLILQLMIRIAKESMVPNHDTTCFMRMWNECNEWIKLILESQAQQKNQNQL